MHPQEAASVTRATLIRDDMRHNGIATFPHLFIVMPGYQTRIIDKVLAYR